MDSNTGCFAAFLGSVWCAMTMSLGKGDHRHYGDQEEPYPFSSVEQLLADFRADCARLAAWRWT